MSEYRASRNDRRGPSFSIKNRLGRLLWSWVYTLFFRLSPRPCHAWRALLLRFFGARLGRRCHVYPGAHIWAPWNLTLGDEVGIADGAILYSQAKIELGDRVVISQGVHLCTGTHDFKSSNFELIASPIHVGADAWIAAEAFVHPGVSIGEGTVIGARSVVVKDLPAWKVCVGHPCKVIKKRGLEEAQK